MLQYNDRQIFVYYQPYDKKWQRTISNLNNLSDKYIDKRKYTKEINVDRSNSTRWPRFNIFRASAINIFKMSEIFKLQIFLHKMGTFVHSDAKTYITYNGHFSDFFRIEKNVRQSCQLFSI